MTDRPPGREPADQRKRGSMENQKVNTAERQEKGRGGEEGGRERVRKKACLSQTHNPRRSDSFLGGLWAFGGGFC